MIMINFIRWYRTSKFSHLTVPSDLHEVIIGLLLGDLDAEKPSANANMRFTFKGGLVNAPYILHLYSLFQQFTKSFYTVGRSKLGVKGNPN